MILPYVLKAENKFTEVAKPTLKNHLQFHMKILTKLKNISK